MGDSFESQVHQETRKLLDQMQESDYVVKELSEMPGSEYIAEVDPQTEERWREIRRAHLEKEARVYGEAYGELARWPLRDHPWYTSFLQRRADFGEAEQKARAAVLRENITEGATELMTKGENLFEDAGDLAHELSDSLLSNLGNREGKKAREKAAKKRKKEKKKRDKKEPTLDEVFEGNNKISEKQEKQISESKAGLEEIAAHIGTREGGLSSALAVLTEDPEVLPGSAAFGALENIHNILFEMKEVRPQTSNLKRNMGKLSKSKFAGEAFFYDSTKGDDKSPGMIELVKQLEEFHNKIGKLKGKKFINRYKGSGSYDGEHARTIESLKSGEEREVDWSAGTLSEEDLEAIEGAGERGGVDEVFEVTSVERLASSNYSEDAPLKLDDAVRRRIEDVVVEAVKLGRRLVDSETGAVIDDDTRNKLAEDATELIIAELSESGEYSEKKLSNYRTAVRIHICDLMKTSLMLTPEQEEEMRKQLERGLRYSGTRDFAQKIVAAGEEWPYGALHYLWRINENLKAHWSGTSDIITLVGEELVDYFFFRQDLLKIHRTAVPSLQVAEQNYLEVTSSMEAEQNFEVSLETGGQNFRAGREDALLRNLIQPGRRLSMHDMGLAIDINYGSSGDKRNPHLKNKDLLYFVRQVLIDLGRDDLASVDLSERAKDISSYETMIEASRFFKDNIEKWETVFLNTVSVDVGVSFSEMPSPREYEAAMKEEGIKKPEDYKELKTLNKEETSVFEAKKKWLDNIEKARRKLLDRADYIETKVIECTKWIDDDQTELVNKHRIALMSVEGFQERSKAVGRDMNLTQKSIEVSSEFVLSINEMHDKWTGLCEDVDNFRAATEKVDGGNVKEKSRNKSRILNTIDNKILVKIEKSKSYYSIVDLSHSKYYETYRSSLEEYNLSKSTLDEDSDLRASWKSQKHLNTLKRYRTHKRSLRYLKMNGFTDHPLALVVAMDKAGWTWGGTFGKPDFHHFEYRSGAQKR